MSLTPFEIQQIVDAIVERLAINMSDDAYMDVHDVAGLIGCSVPTVERLTRTGAIPSHKFGRLRRYRRSEMQSPQNEKGGRNE